MIVRLLVLAVLGLLAAGAAGAETRARLSASGDWAVYRVTGAEVTLDGQAMVIPETCLAETLFPGGVVRIFVAAPEMGAQYRGLTVGLVAASDWSFRSHNETFTLGRLTVAGAYYSGNMVSFSMTPDLGIAYVLQLLAQRASGQQDLLNERRERIGGFSASGMEAAMDRLVQCGGLPSL